MIVGTAVMNEATAYVALSFKNTKPITSPPVAADCRSSGVLRLNNISVMVSVSWFLSFAPDVFRLISLSIRLRPAAVSCVIDMVSYSKRLCRGNCDSETKASSLFPSRFVRVICKLCC